MWPCWSSFSLFFFFLVFVALSSTPRRVVLEFLLKQVWEIHNMAEAHIVMVHTIEECVESVGENPLRVEVLAVATKAIVEAGVEHADHLADTSSSHVDKLAESAMGPANGLIKCALQMSNDVHMAKRMRLSVELNGKAF